MPFYYKWSVISFSECGLIILIESLANHSATLPLSQPILASIFTLFLSMYFVVHSFAWQVIISAIKVTWYSSNAWISIFILIWYVYWCLLDAFGMQLEIYVRFFFIVVTRLISDYDCHKTNSVVRDEAGTIRNPTTLFLHPPHKLTNWIFWEISFFGAKGI